MYCEYNNRAVKHSLNVVRILIYFCLQKKVMPHFLERPITRNVFDKV